jgi:hypothetical protein
LALFFSSIAWQLPLKGNESHSWRHRNDSFELTGGDTGNTLEINKNKKGKNEQDGKKNLSYVAMCAVYFRSHEIQGFVT